MFDRKYIFKGSIFHCYVRLPERNVYICDLCAISAFAEEVGRSNSTCCCDQWRHGRGVTKISMVAMKVFIVHQVI